MTYDTVYECAKTRSGRAISVLANIDSLDDAAKAARMGADGVGVVRSEQLFRNFDRIPDESEQLKYYQKITEIMYGKPITIRTFDRYCGNMIGCAAQKKECNPALGVRGLRMSLSCPNCFNEQLSAILRAYSAGNVSIMFPMVSGEEQIAEAIRIFEAVKSKFDFAGIRYDPEIKVGIMIETPASAILSRKFARYVDFFSIGTNDLSRFTYAADTENAECNRLIPDYPEAVLELVRIAAESMSKYKDKFITVSGDMAADTTFTQTFIDMGIGGFSVAPKHIAKLKEHIAGCR